MPTSAVVAWAFEVRPFPYEGLGNVEIVWISFVIFNSSSMGILKNLLEGGREGTIDFIPCVYISCINSARNVVKSLLGDVVNHACWGTKTR